MKLRICNHLMRKIKKKLTCRSRSIVELPNDIYSNIYSRNAYALYKCTYVFKSLLWLKIYDVLHDFSGQ